MAEAGVRVEERRRKQVVSELAGDDLTAVQVPGEDELETRVAGSLPDARVVRAQDADVPIDLRRGFRAGDGDHAPSVGHVGDAVVDPLAPAPHDGLADAVHADPVVVIPTDGEHPCDLSDPAHEPAEDAQLGRAVHQVPSQEHRIGATAPHGVHNLLAQRVGTAVPEVDVADVQEPARVGPPGNALLADVEGVAQPDLQQRHTLKIRKLLCIVKDSRDVVALPGTRLSLPADRDSGVGSPADSDPQPEGDTMRAKTLPMVLALGTALGTALLVPRADAAESERPEKWQTSIPITFTSSSNYDSEEGTSIDVNDDLGWGFGFGYHFDKRFMLGVDFTWISANYDAHIATDFDGDQVPDDSVDVSGTLDATNLQFVGQYNILPGRITPFVRGSFGWTWVDSNIP